MRPVLLHLCHEQSRLGAFARLSAAAILAAASFLAVLPRAASASCGAEDCPLESRATAYRLGRFGFDVMYQYVDQDRLQIGTRRATVGELPSPEDEVRTLSRTYTLTGRGAFGRLGLGLALPYVEREHQHISHEDDPAGTLQVFRYSGLGDLQLTGQWTVLGSGVSDAPSAVALLGLKLPTGRRDVTSDGEQPEPPARPGTGSLDEMVGIHLMSPVRLRAPGQPSAVMPLFLSAQYRVNGQGTEDYRVGNELQLGTGASYPLTQGLELLGQLNVRVRGKDDPGRTDALRDNTGGTWVYASPGLRVRAAGGLKLYGYAQLPLLQRVNRIQLVSPYHLIVGTSYFFGQ